MLPMNFQDLTEIADNQNFANLPELYLKGDDLQKLSVIQSIPQMLEFDNHATISRIIPKIQQELPNSSSELHLATSRMFRLLIEANVPINLISPVLQGIDCKDPIVSNAWMETLLAIIPKLSEEVVKRDVLTFAISKSQFTQSPYFRVGTCRMLGQISMHPHISSFEVRKDIVPLVQILYQDCFYEVRAAICRELSKVAQGLKSDAIGEAVIKSCILPVLVELSNDDSSMVRCTSVDSVTEIIPFLPLDTIKSTIVPLVRNMCTQSVTSTDMIFVPLAKVYGELMKNLQNAMIPADCEWFLEFYGNLSKRGLSMLPDDFEADPALGMTCREFCAYNLPAITVMVVTMIPTSIDKWYNIFKNLVCDSCYLVRKTVAGCIHEICRILGVQNKIVKPDFVRLLRDEAEEVLESLVPNVQTTLEVFSMSKVLTRENAGANTLEIGRALLKCQADVFRGTNWRLKEAFLKQLETLPYCMPSEYIHQHFTPIVLVFTVDARARPVRSQAAKTILIFLRYNIKENQRRWIRENLINQLCHSISCYTRHIFINMCVAALKVFSWKYFKEHFYLHLLSLAEDPVSTIRYCVVEMCPILKQILTLPLDRQLQLRLENVLSRLEMVETDKDVKQILKAKLKEMRQPHTNKQQELAEEKRKIDEEEKVNSGKSISLYTISVAPQGPEAKTAPLSTPITAMRSRSASRINALTATIPPNEMSFLGKHFYIDAGVQLPNDSASSDDDNTKSSENVSKSDEREVKTKNVDEVVPTISLENTNVDSLSEKDLKELEISTSNITDDVKVSIQEKNLKKSPEVKKRTKRYSCVFHSENKKSEADLRRRSLNLTADSSRIPICSNKTKLQAKKKSESTQSLNSAKLGENYANKSVRSYAKVTKTEVLQDKTDADGKNVPNTSVLNNFKGKSSVENISAEKGVKSKENHKSKSNSIKDINKNVKAESCESINEVPMKVKDNISKSSNLPILVRTSVRSQSERRIPK